VRARRWAYIGVASVLCALLLSACGAAGTSGGTVLVVSPGSIRAGYQVSVRATCHDNLNPAHVTSDAFGPVTLEPDHGLLMTDVMVPAGTPSGTYTAKLSCASGGRSSTTLTVLDGTHPAAFHGPDTGGGQMASTGPARLALLAGLGLVLVGLGLALVTMVRRRAGAEG
jgi:hypothetical protein